jgi:thiamine transport system permease protein
VKIWKSNQIDLVGKKSGLQFLIKKILWLMPLTFVAIFFYLPVSQIVAIGISGDWLHRVFETKTLGPIWFTLWQASLSTLLTVLAALPGAYVLYRKSFFGQKVIRALITIPFVLPSIVIAVGFTVFRGAHTFYQEIGFTFLENPVYWIIAAHIFVNYSIAVKTVGGVWAVLDESFESAAALDGAGRFRIFTSISLPQLFPALVSAVSLIFLFSASSFGIVLVLGGGQVSTIETAIYFAATQRLDLGLSATLVLVQTLITSFTFFIELTT